MVDFGNRVLLNENSKSAYHITTILTNDSAKTLQWDLGLINSDIVNGSFILEPRRGTLEKGQKASVRVSFYPRDNRFYSAVVPIHLDGNNHASLEFEVKGFGTYPMIAFDVREIVLPTVPLGIKSVASFIIVNQGYENLEIQCKLPADKNIIPLKVEFPDGSVLSSKTQTLRALVSFISEKPLAFNSKIDFYDNERQKFSVRVSGATDSSVFTTFGYLAGRLGKYEIKVKGI